MTRATRPALLFALLGACSHGAAGVGAAVAKGNAVKIALRAIATAPELEGSSVPAVFEQSLCTAIFERNDHQVICPDDARAYLKAQRDAALLGGPSASLQEADALLAAPRALSLSASPRAGRILITGLLLDSAGRQLRRFEKDIAADGEDLTSRAGELAAEVVAVP
jgi:F0F1-type ATP synthase membrane subunit c/vacuolar-type H+-ATPase subunit K